ncbi:MAG: hypothetical protein AAGD10_12620 [Myxococcota bacterium]
MSRAPLSLLILPSLVLASACGGGDDDTDTVTDMGPVDMSTGPDQDGDEWLDGEDNCLMIPNPEQRDRDRDGIGDLCDSCPASPGNEEAGCNFVDEVEPNDVTAQAISVVPMGQFREVRGAVEDPTVDQQAVDTYDITVEAKSLYRIRLARADAGSRLQPGFTVSGPGYAPRGAADLFIAERDVYFSQAGTYTITVGDQRGLFGSDASGDEDDTYALAIEEVEVDVRTLTLPANDREIPLIDPTEIVLFETDLVEERFTFIQLAGVVDDDFNNIDTIVAIELSDGQSAESDNVGADVTDSRIVLENAATGTARVVIDHAQILGPRTIPYAVQLSVAQFEILPELEPNDAPELAARLQFPDEPGGMPDFTDGVIQRKAVPDFDWYSFEGDAGEFVRLRVTGQGTLEPFAALFEQTGATAAEVSLIVDADGAPSAQIEAILASTGTYFLAVGDRRNVDDDQSVGGEQFAYTIQATNAFPEVRNIILNSGDFGTTVNSDGRLETNTLLPNMVSVADVQLGGNLAGITPVLAILGQAGDGILAQGLPGARRIGALLDTAAVEYPITLYNANRLKGGYTYNLGVQFEPVMPEVESEPNDSPGQADVIMGTPGTFVPAALTGTIAPDDPDRFTFTTVQPAPVTIFANADGPIDIIVRDMEGLVVGNGNGVIQNFNPPAGPGTYRLQIVAAQGSDYQIIFTD